MRSGPQAATGPDYDGAIAEGFFLAAAILLIYVLGIIDPEQGL